MSDPSTTPPSPPSLWRGVGREVLVALVLVAVATAAFTLRDRDRAGDRDRPAGPAAAGGPEPASAPAGPVEPAPGPKVDLPAYVIGVAAGPREIRQRPGGQGHVAVLVLEPGKRLEIVVRPVREVPEKVDVRLYWVKDGRVRRWNVPLEKAPFTAVRIHGTPEAPFGAGEGELAAVVSAALDIPETPDVAVLRDPPGHWKVMWHPVRWP